MPWGSSWGKGDLRVTGGHNLNSPGRELGQAEGGCFMELSVDRKGWELLRGMLGCRLKQALPCDLSGGWVVEGLCLGVWASSLG